MATAHMNATSFGNFMGGGSGHYHEHQTYQRHQQQAVYTPAATQNPYVSSYSGSSYSTYNQGFVPHQQQPKTRHGQQYHGYHSNSYSQYSKTSALLNSSKPIPTSNLKAHDPLDKKALESWELFLQKSRSQ